MRAFQQNMDSPIFQNAQSVLSVNASAHTAHHTHHHTTMMFFYCAPGGIT